MYRTPVSIGKSRLDEQCVSGSCFVLKGFIFRNVMKDVN